MYPIGFGVGGFSPDMPQWGSEYKQNLKYFPRMMYVLSHNTVLPVETNTITLDLGRKGRMGIA